jgi:hypothetical protein
MHDYYTCYVFNGLFVKIKDACDRKRLSCLVDFLIPNPNIDYRFITY